MVRADDLPLVLPAMSAQGLPRGARVRIRLGEIDEITLDISSTVIERLDVVLDEAAAEQVDEEDNESEIAAGPISIAVDMNDVPDDASAVAPAAT